MGDDHVLILPDREDWSANAVHRELERRKVSTSWLDTASFPLHLRMAASFEDGRWGGSFCGGDCSVQLDVVTAIYYRRPKDFDFPPGMSGTERRFARAQARIGLGGVLDALEGVRWVNRPSAVADAEFKPRQLSVAARVGLATPATLVCNDRREAQLFAELHGAVALKPLAEPILTEGSDISVMYTRKLHPEDLEDSPGIQNTAHLFQEWIDAKYADRLIAAGEALFAVAIRSGSPASQIDWRSDYSALQYQIVECPAAVAAAVRSYLRAEHLVYAAFDFLVSDERGWLFLECNPAGQWGWIAEECDLPVARSLVTCLAGD